MNAPTRARLPCRRDCRAARCNTVSGGLRMKKVTKQEFYAVVGPQDVIARAEKNESIFETRHRVIIGKITPGYLCRDAAGNYTDQKEYFLADRAHA